MLEEQKLKHFHRLTSREIEGRNKCQVKVNSRGKLRILFAQLRSKPCKQTSSPFKLIKYANLHYVGCVNQTVLLLLMVLIQIQKSPRTGKSIFRQKSRANWFLCRKYGFECKNKAYEHILKPVLVNRKYKILQHYRQQLTRKLKLGDQKWYALKTEIKCLIINAAIPSHQDNDIK